MTEQERLDGFAREYNELMKKYGVTLGIKNVAEELGPVIQVRPQTQFVLIPDWQPPAISPIDDASLGKAGEESGQPLHMKLNGNIK